MDEWFSHFLQGAQAEIYDQLQRLRPDYSRAMNELKATLERHVEGKGDGLTVLDIACGTGAATKLLYENNDLSKDKIKRFVGLDSDQKLLQLAQAKCSKLDVIHADMIEAETEETFDVVLCSFAYHHVTDKDKPKLCENMHKWCKHDGDLFVLEICLSASQVRDYYEKVKRELPRNSSMRGLCQSFLDWTMADDQEATGEWKVPLSHLMQDFTSTGWLPRNVIEIWPGTPVMKDAGCFLLHFTPTEKQK